MLTTAKVGMKASYSYNEFDGKGTVYGTIISVVPNSHVIMTNFDKGIDYCLMPDLTDEDHIVKFYNEKGAVIYNSCQN